MPKRITIEPHLSLNELETRYRGAKDPVERSHYQIIWLLATGRPTEEVAAVTGGEPKSGFMSWSGDITGKVQNPSETPVIKILEVSRF